MNLIDRNDKSCDIMNFILKLNKLRVYKFLKVCCDSLRIGNILIICMNAKQSLNLLMND